MNEKLVDILMQTYDHKLLEMLTGKLLGDGNILIEKNKSPRFRFGHARKDRIWCLKSYQNLCEYLQLSPPKFRRVFDKRLVAGYSDLYYVQSTIDELYVLLKELWYPVGIKQLPFALVKKVLSPLCLAWWYQDDGNLNTHNNTPKKVVLSTESFSLHEIEYLRELLQKNYHILFSIDGQNRMVLYDKPSIIYFLSLVRPYLVIKRKDIYWNDIDPSTLPHHHRTSLYISSDLNFEKPTKEIKLILQRIKKKINVDIAMEEVHNFYFNNLRNLTRKTYPYQIELDREDLWYLAFFQARTGLTKGESIEYFHYLLTRNISYNV